MDNVNRIDELELAMLDCEPVDCPVSHFFIDGFYCRQIFMPAVDGGTLITSQVHRTFHTYQVSKGVVHVKINDGEWQRIEAPFCGVTEPGTRRVLLVEEDTIWTTFHQILESEQPAHCLEEEVTEAVEKIGNRIIEPHVNTILGGVLKNNKVIKPIQNENY